MSTIKQILENQKEVQYLTYFLIQDDKDNTIVLNIYTVDIYKKYKFRDEDSCLAKLFDILQELKKLERWSLIRLERSTQRKR